MSGPTLAISYNSRMLGAALYEEDTCVVRILNDIAEDEDFKMLKSLIDEVNPSLILANKIQDAVYIGALRQFCNHKPFDLSTITLESDKSELTDEQKAFVREKNLLDSTNTGTLKDSMSKEDIPCETCDDVEMDTGKIDQEKEDGECDTTVAIEKSSQEMEKLGIADKNQEEGEIEDEDDDEEEEKKIPIVLTLLPNMAFGWEDAKKRLEKLVADGVNDTSILASFRFDFEARNMIRAFGALLRYLDQQRVGVEFEEISKKTPIKSIRTLVIDKLVEIDATTYKALEIFESEYNPSLLKKKYVYGQNVLGMKEGLSLFKLCNLCRSIPGKRMLKRWFERPILNHEILKQRQQAISFFHQDCNLDITGFLRNKLKGVNSLRPLFRRMQSGTVSVADWKSLYSTAITIMNIGEILSEREVVLEILKGKMKFFGENLIEMAAVLNQMIDFTGSNEENRFVVNEGVDEQLDKLKELYAQLPEMMTEMARVEADDLNIDSCSVAYVPIIGYLLVIPTHTVIPDDSSLKLVFTADTMHHFKSTRMYELDREIGDIKMQIIDMETSITIRLQQMVIKRTSIFIRAIEASATIDCLIALSLAAREHNWVRPKLVDEPVIDVSLARHPLSEMACPMNFVANPIKSGEENTKIKLISGPNASGKSVYLKMMSSAIRKCDANSLVIIDEFGKGTMTEVGLSLLASCLNFWIDKGVEGCPHIYVSSHFHALPTLLVDTPLMSFHTMDVLKNDNDLEFQYKFIEGVIDNSFASYTARKNGIPDEIVDRADEVYELLKSGCSIAMIPHQDPAENQKREEAADRMKAIVDRFMEWDLEEDPEGFLELAKAILIDQNE